jgi:hypothetical protein
MGYRKLMPGSASLNWLKLREQRLLGDEKSVLSFAKNKEA